MSKFKILIIEDQKSLVEPLKKTFNARGIETLVSYDGQDGENKIVQEKPDLILLDLLLPQKSGLEILEWLRTNKQPDIAALPVVIITNYSEKAYVEKTKELGITDFMIKSNFDLHTIVDRVIEHLENIKKA